MTTMSHAAAEIKQNYFMFQARLKHTLAMPRGDFPQAAESVLEAFHRAPANTSEDSAAVPHLRAKLLYPTV